MIKHKDIDSVGCSDTYTLTQLAGQRNINHEYSYNMKIPDRYVCGYSIIIKISYFKSSKTTLVGLKMKVTKLLFNVEGDDINTENTIALRKPNLKQIAADLSKSKKEFIFQSRVIQ